MEGVVDLRAAIADKLQVSYARRVDPETEITVTCGGTEALYDSIQAVVRAGDEAIIFDPSYDAYEPAIRLAGGRCVAGAADSADVPLRLGSHPRRRERSHAPHHHQQPAEPELQPWRTRTTWIALASLVRDRRSAFSR